MATKLILLVTLCYFSAIPELIAVDFNQVKVGNCSSVNSSIVSIEDCSCTQSTFNVTFDVKIPMNKLYVSEFKDF